MALVKSPKDAWESMVDKGVELSQKSSVKIFHQATLSGCYIGFGGMLSCTIAGGLATTAKDNPGIQMWVFGALFPINLIIIILTGGVLFTGITAVIPGAIYEGRIRWTHLPRMLAVSWLGNLTGALLFAGIVTFCEMNTGSTAVLAAKLTEKKCSHGFLQTTLKAVLCNWMVCMAIYLSTQAQDMTGKILAIWWPIMTFVATGYEHLPANQFTLLLGLMSGHADVTLGDVVLRNWAPATLGNFIAGALVVAGSYSFAYGRLGGNAAALLPVEKGAGKEPDLEEATLTPVFPAAAKPIEGESPASGHQRH